MAKKFGAFHPVVRAMAGPHDADGVSVAFTQGPLHLKQHRRVVDLSQRIRVEGIQLGEQPRVIYIKSLHFPLAASCGNGATNCRRQINRYAPHSLQLTRACRENLRSRTKLSQEAPDPDGAKIRNQVQGEKRDFLIHPCWHRFTEGAAGRKSQVLGQ